MKKLFKAIRDNDPDEVRSVIEAHPEVIDEAAVPPPKKDIGQSPLQVAIKTGAFDIAHYLIEQGADVNFMEEEAEGTSLRCPLLHDAIRAALHSLCYNNFEDSDKATELVGVLCERGADPNKRASNGFDALNACLNDAELILERREAYPDVQDIAEKQLIRLLDILIEYGADFVGWAHHGHFPEPSPMETNKERYLDDFVPKEDVVTSFTYRGKTRTTVIKGDIDRNAHTRAVMQRYVRDRGVTV